MIKELGLKSRMYDLLWDAIPSYWPAPYSRGLGFKRPQITCFGTLRPHFEGTLNVERQEPGPFGTQVLHTGPRHIPGAWGLRDLK